MKKRYYITLLILLLGGIAAGVYFKDNVKDFFTGLGQEVQDLQKTDFQHLIGGVAKNILAPSPLHIGGQENNVVLTKAGVFLQTNLQRQANGGLPPLAQNAKLNAAALAKAKDIFLRQYFEHVSPVGVDPGELVKSFGYDYIVSGENLILGNFGSEKELVQAWMDSPGHRANILHGRFVDIGVAVIKGTYQGRTVWVGVQEFGLPLSFCPGPSDTLKREIDNNKDQLDSLAAKIESKKQQIEATNRRDPGYNALVQEHNQLVEQYNQLAAATKNLISQYNIEVNNFNQCAAGN